MIYIIQLEMKNTTKVIGNVISHIKLADQKNELYSNPSFFKSKFKI